MPVTRRGHSIVVKFQIAGTIYRRTIPEATSIAQGKVVEAQMKRDIFEGKYGMGRDILFSDFVEIHAKPYRRANYRANVDHKLNMFSRAFKGKALKDIAPFTIDAWKQRREQASTRRKRPPHPATIQNDLALLSWLFNLACDNDFLSKNPMRQVRRYSQADTVCKRTRLFRDDEEERLFNALERRGGEVYWAPLIARHTGMRQKEVLRLKRDDVDFQQWTVTIRMSKNGWPRTLPIIDKLKPIFLEMPVNRDGYLFSMRTGRSFQTSESAWGKACKEAKVEDFRYNDLRHVFASSLPPDPYLRAAWLGHVKVETSFIYSHVGLDEMRQAAEAAKVLVFQRTAQPRDKQTKVAGIAK